MEDLLIRAVANFLGGGVVIAGLLWLSKTALAKAVQLAGEKEIEKYKGELTSQLEQAKATYARDLELFKSELTLGAEVRRQVAAKKVQALLEIVEQGEPLIRLVGDPRPENQAEQHAAMMKFWGLVRDRQHFFDPKVFQEFNVYVADLMKAHAQWESDETAWKRADEARAKFLARVRTELGIVAAA